MRVVLDQGFDGYNGLVSPDASLVAVGRGQASIVTLATGVVTTLFNGASARPMGWWEHPLRLIVQRYEDNCEVVAYDPLTGAETVLAAGQNISMAEAGGGHWSSGYAGLPRIVVWDGIGLPLSEGLDWNVGGDGDWTVCLDERTAAAHVFLRGVKHGVAAFPPGVTRWYAYVRDAMCGFGRNGRPQMLSCSSGEITDVTVSPTGQESEPRWALGEIATAIEGPPVPYGEVRPGCVAIRQFQSQECITLDVPEGAVGCDFRVIGNRGIVASWSDTGRCVIQDCDLTQPRHALVAPTPPVILPPEGTITLSPGTGFAPLAVTATLTLTQGATMDVRFYAQHPDGALARWGGGNRTTASGVLPIAGLWSSYARMRGVGGALVNTPVVYVAAAAPVVVPPAPTWWRGIQGGYAHQPLGPEWMEDIAAHNISLLRIDGMNAPTTAALVAAVDAECWRVGIRPLYMGLLPLMELVPEGAWFELGWRPKSGTTPMTTGTEYGRWAIVAQEIAARRNLRLWLGCIDNLNNDWLAPGKFVHQMIRAMGATAWGKVRDVSFHWYPDDKAQSFHVGHDGRTRQGDVDFLRSVVGWDRTLLGTEEGYHLAPVIEHTGFLGKGRKVWQLTELEALDRYRQAEQFWRDQVGVIGWTAYQLVDAPKSDPGYMKPINRYGWREASVNGVSRWKAQSRTWL